MRRLLKAEDYRRHMSFYEGPAFLSSRHAALDLVIRHAVRLRRAESKIARGWLSLIS